MPCRVPVQGVVTGIHSLIVFLETKDALAGAIPVFFLIQVSDSGHDSPYRGSVVDILFQDGIGNWCVNTPGKIHMLHQHIFIDLMKRAAAHADLTQQIPAVLVVQQGPEPLGALVDLDPVIGFIAPGNMRQVLDYGVVGQCPGIHHLIP